MELTKRQIDGLGIALNEASLFGAEVDIERRVAVVTFSLLALAGGDEVPADSRAQFTFRPFGRIAASLRDGLWNDPDAEVLSFEIQQLNDVISDLGKQPIYGWSFFNSIQGDAPWLQRLSLDIHTGIDDGYSNSIVLFQEGHFRHLDLCIWFDDLRIFDPESHEIEIQEIIDDGQRWWEAFRKGDSDTEGKGIYPLSP